MEKLLNMKKRTGSERGSYTLEACISLMAMVIAVAFVYSQVKVVICESIMQHAVDNMALEMSSYIYILDKLGVVAHHSEDEIKNVVDAGEQGAEAVKHGKAAIADVEDMAAALDNVPDLLSLLEKKDEISASGKDAVEEGKSMVESIKKMISLIKSDNFMNELKRGGFIAAESGLTLLIDGAASEYYDWKLDSYLPTDRDKFCKEYLVDPNSISFKNSKLMPGMENNTILVVVEYKTNSPFAMFPIKRQVVKQAFTAVWLADPGNG